MIAEVKFSCGRYYLSVADIPLAMEGDKCRTANLPIELYDPIPPHELETAAIGDKPVKDMDPKVVLFFRGSTWNKAMLDYVADHINQEAQDYYS